jgi:hypothetical protein
MTDEQLAAFINAQSVIALATIQAMVAENQRREAEGNAQAYDSSSFFAVRDEIEDVLRKLNMVL